MSFRHLLFALLINSSLSFSMDDPSINKALTEIETLAHKNNALKAQIALAEELSKKKAEEFELRARMLKQQKSIATKEIATHIRNQVEDAALQGAALVVQKALDFGYHTLLVPDRSSDLAELGDSVFSITKLVAFNEVVLKSLRYLTNHKGHIFSHRVNYHGAVFGSHALLKQVRKNGESNQKERYITARLINECFGTEQQYDDSLLERAAIATMGTILIAPALAVDLSNAVVAFLNFKKTNK